MISGGQEPERCQDKYCLAVSPKLEVSAAVYAEALAGAGSVQGTIAWLPYASGQLCRRPDGEYSPVKFNYQIGRVLFVGTVRAGWAFSYKKVYTIYEDKKQKTSYFPIF